MKEITKNQATAIWQIFFDIVAYCRVNRVF